MKHIHTSSKRGFFKPLIASRQVQAAMMVLAPGGSSSDQPENEHPAAEQWLFVVGGAATARIEGRSIKLKTGSLLLVEKGEKHQITNTGSAPLVTLNFYAPPAYTRDGEVKPTVAR